MFNLLTPSLCKTKLSKWAQNVDGLLNDHFSSKIIFSISLNTNWGSSEIENLWDWKIADQICQLSPTKNRLISRVVWIKGFSVSWKFVSIFFMCLRMARWWVFTHVHNINKIFTGNCKSRIVYLLLLFLVFESFDLLVQQPSASSLNCSSF